jgi:hypothetical protein
MERRSIQAVSTRLASVVRQFTPSRIEHQLLAQVFEFVVTVPCQGQSAAFDSVDAQQPSEELPRADGRTSRGTARSAA